MTLHYLDFDYSEDAEGTGTWDAMASVAPAQLSALHAEAAQVLAWAHQEFPGQLGPLEEGGEWHYELQGQQEWTLDEHLHFDEATGHIQAQPEPARMPRHTLTLTLSGTPAFCAAFRQWIEKLQAPPHVWG